MKLLGILPPKLLTRCGWQHPLVEKWVLPEKKKNPKPLGSDVWGALSSLFWMGRGVWVNQLDFGRFG